MYFEVVWYRCVIYSAWLHSLQTSSLCILFKIALFVQNDKSDKLRSQSNNDNCLIFKKTNTASIFFYLYWVDQIKHGTRASSQLRNKKYTLKSTVNNKYVWQYVLMYFYFLILSCVVVYLLSKLRVYYIEWC